MTAQHDYYQILGIDPGANLDAIRKAYRRRALDCHPDRGGSHEQMVVVIEAWEVLSKPESRRRYDAARGMPKSPMVQEAADADANQARQRAEQYPRQWADFEVWLNKAASDFTGAKYGSAPIDLGIFYFRVPTVEKSVSGILFLVVGGIVSGVLLCPLIYHLMKDDSGKALRHDPRGLICLGLPILGGVWAGALLHQWIRNAIRTASKQAGRQGESNSSSEEGEVIIIACSKCSQKLRVPSVSSELLVTCGSCQHKFSCRPSLASGNPSDNYGQLIRQKLSRRVIKVGMVVGAVVGAFMTDRFVVRVVTPEIDKMLSDHQDLTTERKDRLRNDVLSKRVSLAWKAYVIGAALGGVGGAVLAFLFSGPDATNSSSSGNGEAR